MCERDKGETPQHQTEVGGGGGGMSVQTEEEDMGYHTLTCCLCIQLILEEYAINGGRERRTKILMS